MKTGVVHRPVCSAVSRMNPGNRQSVGSPEGYKRYRKCNP